MGESGSLVRACCFHKNLLEQTTAQAQGSSHPCAPVRGQGRGKGGGGWARGCSLFSVLLGPAAFPEGPGKVPDCQAS